MKEAERTHQGMIRHNLQPSTTIMRRFAFQPMSKGLSTLVRKTLPDSSPFPEGIQILNLGSTRRGRASAVDLSDEAR